MEMLADDEVRSLTNWISLKYGSLFAAAAVQVPLSILYYQRYRSQPKVHKHLLTRIKAMPLVTVPAFLISNWHVRSELS